jgi:hypothetical protein
LTGARGDQGTAEAGGPSDGGPTGELTDADLATLGALRRCTACRACDVAFDGYASAARPVFRGPSELVLDYAQNLPDHAASKRYLESLCRGDLQALERVCPVGIPFVALSDLLSRRVAALAPEEKPEPDSRTPHDPG